MLCVLCMIVVFASCSKSTATGLALESWRCFTTHLSPFISSAGLELHRQIDQLKFDFVFHSWLRTLRNIDVCAFLFVSGEIELPATFLSCSLPPPLFSLSRSLTAIHIFIFNIIPLPALLAGTLSTQMAAVENDVTISLATPWACVCVCVCTRVS